MSVFYLRDVSTWVGGYNLSCDSNSVELASSLDELDATTFCSDGARERAGGLADVTATVEGFWQPAVDAEAWAQLARAMQTVTMSPDGAEGSVAYLHQSKTFSYTAFGAIGDLTPFSLSMSNTGRDGLVRGRVAAAKQTVTATGPLGTALELGAAASKVIVAVHVFTAGTSIAIDLESDADNTFASASTVASIGPLTTTGGTWSRTTGAVTDTWWRLNVTAVTGSFEAAAVIAVV